MSVAGFAHAGPFATDDLVVFQADTASANKSTFTIVDWNSWTANQTPSNSIAIEGGTGAGATAANSVLKLFDSAGFNQTINLGAATTLYTAPAAATVKGMELAPVAVPEPAAFVLAGLGGLLLSQLLRRRKNSARGPH